MSATLTIAPMNRLPMYVGRWRTIQLNQSGGTAWTSGSPITLTGGTGASILPGSQAFNNSGNTVTLTIELGATAGNLTLTDTVNNTTVSLPVIGTYTAPAFSGATRYVLGGVAQPPPPSVVAAPVSNGTQTPGTATWYYQIIARNSVGVTQGFSIISKPSYNPSGVNFGIGCGITAATTSATTLSSSTYNLLYWAAIPGATSYDVLRSSDGATWYNQSNTTLTTFNDQSNTNGAAYTLPTANTTALGNDSYDGTSATYISGTTGPWATAAHAAANLTSGQTLNVAGWVTDSSQVIFPAGVWINGSGVTSSTLYSTFSNPSTQSSYVPPSNGYISNLTFSSPPATSVNTRVVGNMGNDPTVNGCEFRNVRVIGGQSSSFYSCLNSSFTTRDFNSQLDFYDCDFIGTHGSAGGAAAYNNVSPTAPLTLNYTRCRMTAADNGVFTTLTSQAVNAIGNQKLRDCNVFATVDTLNIPNCQAAAIRLDRLFACNVKVVNGSLRGQSQDISATSTTSAIFLDGTVSYDATKPTIPGPQGGGAVNDTPVTPTITNAGVYQTDPLFSSSFGASGTGSTHLNVGGSISL